MGRVALCEVRGPSVPILCPIRLIPSKVPRHGTPGPTTGARRELIGKFYVNYVTPRITRRAAVSSGRGNRAFFFDDRNADRNARNVVVKSETGDSL